MSLRDMRGFGRCLGSYDGRAYRGYDCGPETIVANEDAACVEPLALVHCGS